MPHSPAPLSSEIEAIKARNARVEADKAWETSKARKSLVTFITYILAAIVMIAIGVEHPFSNALIPTLGFFLSTLTVRRAKALWIEHIYKKEALRRFKWNCHGFQVWAFGRSRPKAVSH